MGEDPGGAAAIAECDIWDIRDAMLRLRKRLGRPLTPAEVEGFRVQVMELVQRHWPHTTSDQGFEAAAVSCMAADPG